MKDPKTTDSSAFIRLARFEKTESATLGITASVQVCGVYETILYISIFSGPGLAESSGIFGTRQCV